MQTSRTIGIDWERGCLLGEVDGLMAVGQAVKLILETPRWQHPIFSGEYGSEVESLVGKHRDLIRGELERLIAEALLEDERILGVEDFTLSFLEDGVHATFTVNSLYGELKGERDLGI